MKKDKHVDILVSLYNEYQANLEDDNGYFIYKEQEIFNKKINNITEKCLEICEEAADTGNKYCKISFERFLSFTWLKIVPCDYNFHISQKEKNNIIQAVAKRLTEEGLTTKIETHCKFENDILVIQWISNI